MDFEKSELPSYEAVVPQWRKPGMRRSRVTKLGGVLALIAFIVYAQWTQIPGPRQDTRSTDTSLSIEKLQADLATCSKLRSKPQNPIGAGRDRNARYIDGHKATLIKNATVWTGEPVGGTSLEDAHAGIGYSWITADVFLEFGLIKAVGTDLDLSSFSSDYLVWNANGRQLTVGIIDMHSHAGVDALPELEGDEDTNEMSSDITPYVRSIDGFKPFDHQIQVIKSGGVTTSLVLPGSGNNIGGEAYIFKHATGKADGREEISAVDMLADPDRNWRYMKMACGENAKRVYGKVGEHGPVSRLGESWEFRHAFETAAKIVREQDDWCNQADAVGVENMASYLPQELKWESLAAALRGQVHINTHCYTVPDLEAFVDHTNEFKFPVRAFHHAHQTYLVPEILKRAWGDSPPASALFADNMWYKAESYVGSEYAGKILWENGLTPIYVSDNPVLNAQHVVFEAGKAYKYGLPYHAALASVTTAPAERLGLGERLGKIKPGYDADVVVWDSDPLSVGAAPVQIWIDGTAQYEDPVELTKPLTAPITPNRNLGVIAEGALAMEDVIFTGISKSFLGDEVVAASEGETLTAVISNGKITCIGTCLAAFQSASMAGSRVVKLKNGYLTKPFVAFGSTIGLNAIDAERGTDNGASTEHFSRGIDGLKLDTKKLNVAYKYGVTQAITAPKFTGQATHFGTSVGFKTSALHALEKGAVFVDDAAVHYTLDGTGKKTHGSISAATGALRHKLLKAAEGHNDTAADEFSESAFLRKVLAGDLALALTVHSADGIVSALKLKKTVEDETKSSLTLVIIGGAESPLLADELAAANVGVVLAPLLSYRSSWDERRALTGAPLTNGTAIDKLLEAGVVTAIGLEEDWLVRDLGLLAGIAYHNGGGKVSEKQALNLVGKNVFTILGLKQQSAGEESEDFLVYEGSPLDIDGRVKAVGDGRGSVTFFE